MKKLVSLWLSTAALLLSAGSARATTLSVGPGATYTKIMDAWAAAKPGDIIEVQGGQTYTGPFLLKSDQSGTAKAPITLRGISVNGHRPILKGIGSGWDNMVVLLNADYFVMESFEIVGNDNDTDYCLVHKADNVTLRDLVVHDCLHQGGLVSTDDSAGSLTLEYSEFYHNGWQESSHQLYMATDQTTFPHSTFRMQYCYVHDGVGGNNVKTRAERNEIYYNWIEGAYYHELDLIGPDVGGSPRRCDSDVVGNVFVKTSSWRVARIGGDGSGDSMGRFRFVNNTMVLADVTTTAIGLQYTVSSLEMYNNVIFAPKSGVNVYRIDDQSGPAAVFFGSNNWIVNGMTSVPKPWTMTVMGADPGFVDPSMDDLRPQEKSPLVSAGATTTASTGSLAFPSPLSLPAWNPPERRLIPVGSAEARTFSGAPSIGALEPTAGAPPPPVQGEGGAPTIGGGSGAGDTGGSGSSGGCKCRVAEEPGGSVGWLGGLAAVGLALARRRRR